MIDEHSMETYKEQIKSYAVCLNNKIGTGSGFLFIPKNSDDLYIFTALHVVVPLFKNIDEEKLIVNWAGQQKIFTGKELAYCTLYPKLDEEIERQKEYGTLPDGDSGSVVLKQILDQIEQELESRDEKTENRDAAVLRIPKKDFQTAGYPKEPILWKEEETIPSEESFLGYGYPNGKEVPLDLYGRLLSWNSNKNVYECQSRNKDIESFPEAMEGFSGTALMTQKQGRLVLAGFVVSCKERELHQCFRSVGVSKIVHRMKQIGWETPAPYQAGQPPESFFAMEILELEQSDLKNMYTEVQRELKNEFYEISTELKMEQVSANEVFYNIPVCELERISCPRYWRGRLWTYYIHKRLNGDKEKNRYFLRNEQGEKEELSLKFVCTEGEKNSDLASVVASAVKGRVLGSQMKGNCILVWQSKENPSETAFSRRKFRNIVENIAEGNGYGMNGRISPEGYDLLKGEMREKNYGIFHINYLIQRLNHCEKADTVQGAIREVLDEVWK